MRKVKFFMNYLKERDWLEEMAREGWLLDDISVGAIYKFKKSEPCEKVYEVERFALSYSGNAGKRELTGRKTAFDIASQTGWEIVTHDESMNYYFRKDRAGDESDELYGDEESRRLRAEKWRGYMSVDAPKMLLGLLLSICAIYMICLFMMGSGAAMGAADYSLLWVFFIGVTVEAGFSLLLMTFGERVYHDMLLSREQWEKRKKYCEKRKFQKAEEMLAYLTGKDAEGLAFAGCGGGRYLFEPTAEHYVYYADTSRALSKRRRAAGKKPVRESKDWEGVSTAWHEASMEEAEKLGLEVVCAVDGGTLIYRRKKSLPPVVWDSGAGRTGYGSMLYGVRTMMLGALAVGFAAGLILGII